MADPTHQSIPDDAQCPDCGADPTAASMTEHRLGNMGYLHDDRDLECSACDTEWKLGIPDGSYEGATDLVCGGCDTLMAVHRVELPLRSAEVYAKYRNNPEFKVHLKCPTCYHFTKVTRHADDSGVALIGDPRTTGSLDGADAMGYPDDHAGPGRVDPPDREPDGETPPNEASDDNDEADDNDESDSDADGEESDASDEASPDEDGEDDGSDTPDDE